MQIDQNYRLHFVGGKDYYSARWHARKDLLPLSKANIKTKMKLDVYRLDVGSITDNIRVLSPSFRRNAICGRSQPMDVSVRMNTQWSKQLQKKPKKRRKRLPILLAPPRIACSSFEAVAKIRPICSWGERIFHFRPFTSPTATWIDYARTGCAVKRQGGRGERRRRKRKKRHR